MALNGAVAFMKLAFWDTSSEQGAVWAPDHVDLRCQSGAVPIGGTTHHLISSPYLACRAQAKPLMKVGVRL